MAEGLRRSSGYHYGESLFAQITEFKNSDVFEAVSKERTRAPRWYSEEVRGMLSQLVRVLDEKELGAFCQEYAEKEVLSRFEDNPLDRFFKYFKPFLCGPSSKCSVRILSTFLKKICEKPKIQISPFFTNLYGQVEQEVKLMFDEEKWKEESREYLNQLLDLEFPEEYKKIIRDSVQG